MTSGYQRQHSLADVLNPSTTAGLRIKFLHEFSYCNYWRLPQLAKGEGGWWRLPEDQDSLPLLFSLKATK